MGGLPLTKFLLECSCPKDGFDDIKLLSFRAIFVVSMNKLTLKAIAAHFNVSVSTVSKAINDSHEISEELKVKIRKFAKQNHYKPNRVALNLLNRNTKTIGVVIPNILNYFFVQVLFGIEQVADERGYSIITCSTNESLGKEVKILDFLCSGSVDGVIISTVAGEAQLSEHIAHFEELLQKQIPLVMFDRVTEMIECDKVVVDDIEAGYKATKHFLETGCRSLAIINPIPNSSIGRLRIEGFKRALKEQGIPFDSDMVVSLGVEDDLELTLSLSLNLKELNGILVFDEITTVKVMDLLRSKGFLIPKDISVIGFTNGELSRYASPPVTMISQHGRFIGETSANKLIDRIEGKDDKAKFETKTIKTSLVVRQSTLSMGQQDS